MVGSVVVRDVMVVTRVKILQSDPKGKPPFEMCRLYMGIAQIALDPPLSVKQANMELKCPKPSWQVLTPPGNVRKKVAQTILASLYTLP